MGLFDSFRKKLSSTSGNERSLLSRKIQDSPQDPQARQKLGLFLLRQGEIVEGLDQLARSAILYEKSGFTAKAIAVLRHILKNDPASLEFRRWLIRLLAQHGHTGDALSELQKIAAGGIRFENQEKKIEFLRGISEYLPNSPLPFLLVADVYLYERKLVAAIDEMERAVSLVSSSGMEKEFEGRMNVLSSLSGENLDFIETCGFLWVAAGRPGDAQPFLGKKAAALRKSGDPELAAEAEQVLAALAEERAASFAGAMSFRDAARKLSEPEAPVPAPERERASYVPESEEEKVLQSAVEKLQAKVTEEIGESDPEARYNLGIAYKEMGLLEEAVQEFLLCRSNPSLFLGASSLLAETLAEKGDVTAAIEALDEVLSSETIGPAETRDVRYQKAVLLSRSGREEEAEAIFLSLYEGSPDYRDLRKRVKKIKG